VSHRVHEPIEVVDYDPAWPAEFERLKGRALAALGELAVAVEHVGSSAVPGLAAKPIVDLYAVVEDVPAAIERLTALGYVHQGDLGIPGREAFDWPRGERRHHLYVCPRDHEGLDEVLRFRDYLREHPEEARAYAELKRELAVRHRDDRDAYGAAKTAFIRARLGSPP
jgi:GrpB-like predicted nucleotidyltransferase (UPF0157 family)